MNKEIIPKCKTGDRDAQRVLYETLYGKVYTVCKRYVKSREDTLEVVNSSFLSVFMNIEQYNEQGEFEAWVRRIVVNKSIDFLRAKKKLEVLVEEDELSYLNKMNVSYNKAIEKFSIEEMDVLLDSLPNLHRIVFNMHAIEGYTHKEISAHLSISELTSRKYLTKARKMLKSMIQEPKEMSEVK